MMFQNAQGQEESDQNEAEWAFSSDVMTAIQGKIGGENEDFYFPNAYFIDNFQGQPKEKWPEIWEATKHLGNSKKYEKKRPSQIIHMGEISDVLPIEME